MYPGMWDLWADTRQWEIREACGVPARTRIRAGEPAAVPPAQTDPSVEPGDGPGPQTPGGDAR